MISNKDWLWDRKITKKQTKAIFSDPKNEHFLSLASLLFSRKNSPKEVFKHYLKPMVFVINWNGIKRQMRKNRWNDPRIEFWQAIYENLRGKYIKKGIPLEREYKSVKPTDEFCKEVADKIKTVRKQNGLTQKELAKKLKVSQQMVAHIESGKENISLLTLKNIVDKLGAKLHLEIS